MKSAWLLTTMADPEGAGSWHPLFGKFVIFMYKIGKNGNTVLAHPFPRNPVCPQPFPGVWICPWTTVRKYVAQKNSLPRIFFSHFITNKLFVFDFIVLFGDEIGVESCLVCFLCVMTLYIPCSPITRVVMTMTRTVFITLKVI